MNFCEKVDKNYDEYSFGKYVRMRRKQLGFSCRQFAKMMEMSAVYLSDIERGNRKAPFLKIRNGKDYMANFIKCLQISEEDIVSFYEMAAASRGLSLDIQEYLKSNKYAQIAVRLAKEVDLSDEEWESFISHMVKIKMSDKN